MQKREIIKDFFSKHNNLVSLAQYIDFCLYSEHGFYNSNNAFGKSGHFVTAPEISSAFSACVAIYLANYILQNNETEFEIIEIGSGNGLFLSEIISTFRIFNIKNIDFISIEKSQYNRNLLFKKFNHNVEIFENISDAIEAKKNKQKIFISNELLDAYPIDQYRKNGNNYEKCFIKYDQQTNILSQEYIKDFDHQSLSNYINSNPNAKQGSIIEYSDFAIEDFHKICNIVNNNGGVILFFDYGYIAECLNQSTLQAINNHSKCNIFHLPLEADITHLVNLNHFIKIGQRFSNLKQSFLSTQNNFLLQNGLREIVENYISNERSIEKKRDIEASTSRLFAMDNFFALGLFFRC